jgi:hypothetical protein
MSPSCANKFGVSVDPGLPDFSDGKVYHRITTKYTNIFHYKALQKIQIKGIFCHLGDDASEYVEEVPVLAHRRHSHHGTRAIQWVGHGLARDARHRAGDEVEVMWPFHSGSGFYLVNHLDMDDTCIQTLIYKV